MKRICRFCRQEKDTEYDFSWKVKSRGIRNTRCKSCQSQMSKNHYENNKQAYSTRARGSVVIAENRKRLIEYLSGHGCIDCGQTDVRVLDFDHVRGEKSEHVVRMVGVGYSWASVELEIAKCEVRCANCYRLKTGENMSSWRHSSEPSPENMLLGRHNEILLSDFGIALVAQSSRFQSMRDMAGTIACMAPEQIQAHPHQTSDQYSLGVVVYEWLCGERPFYGTFTEIAAKHMVTSPPSLRKHQPTLPVSVEQTVLKALSEDPKDRFKNVQAFAEALEQAG